MIPNGFDTEDFHGLASGAPNPKFTLTYTGSFYDRRQPEALWKALRHLCQTGKIDPADVHIAIIGRNTPAFVLGEYEKDPLILSMLHFTGFIQHRESLRQMLNADALLLYIPSGQNTESILTGKIFDYLFSEKPVLAIVPPMGEAARLLTGAGIGFIADHTDIAGIECRITELYDLWKCGELAELKADASFIGGYSRKLHATRLSAFLLSLPEP